MDITTLEVVSYKGHAINDRINFEATIPIELSPLADVSVESVERAGAFPSYATKSLQGKVWVLDVIVKAGNISDLMKWFNPADLDEGALIVKDTENGDKQWYVMAVTDNMPVFRVNHAVVRVYAADPVWRSVEEVEEAWNIVASGATLALTNNGNQDAYLKLDIQPTASKTGNYYKHRFAVRAYHVNNAALPNWSIVAVLNTAALVADNTVSNQINQVGGIAAGDMTFPIDTPVGGGLSSSGGMLYVGTEQIKYDSIVAGVVNVSSGGRGWAGTTAAIHTDNAVCYQSRCRADGNDIRVFEKGVELERWLNDMNTASTEIWLEGLNFEADLTMTLEDAIAGSGDVTQLSIENTVTNRENLQKLDPSGGILEVVTSGTPEVFVYDGLDARARRINITARAARGTSMAAHNPGDTVRFRQFDLYIYCGDEDASAPVVDDTNNKPACDLSSSNGTLVFSEFGNAARTRPFSWALSTLRTGTKKSTYYTGDRGANADPATELGLLLACVKVNGVWRPEDGEIVARFYAPCVIDSVAGSGEKRRQSSDWAERAGIEKSKNGRRWDEVASISTPSAANTWENWSIGTTALGSGYKHVQLVLDGSLRGGVANNRNHLEANAITLVLTNPVQVSVGSREDMYDLNCEFRVDETDEAIGLVWSMMVNEVLYFDSVARTVTHEDGTNAFRALSKNTKRIAWLRIPPGGATLVFSEAGAAGLTVDVHYEERNL